MGSPAVAETETGIFICRRDPRTVFAASQNAPSMDIFRLPWEQKFSNLSSLVNANEVVHLRALTTFGVLNQSGLGDLYRYWANARTLGTGAIHQFEEVALERSKVPWKVR